MVPEIFTFFMNKQLTHLNFHIIFNKLFLKIVQEGCVMKNLLGKICFLSFLVTVLAGCGGTPSVSSSSGGLALDTAIEQAAERMEKAFNAGTEIALVSVSSPSIQFSEYVLTYLESILVNNGKLTVVDRANLDKVRAEQGFQLSGDVSDESAKAIGQMLGAGAIVTGTLVNLGDAYRLTLKAINVETARVAASYPADIANSPRVQTLLASSGGTSGGTQRGTTGGNITATPAPAVPTYTIGDIGPAGGIVFYDKGNSGGGWRYLEVAPADTERTAVYYYPDQLLRALHGSRRVGDGKENTDKFIAEFQRRGGEVNTAPWFCTELTINGFDDWYLPSTDELLYIYNNLYLKGLGDFTNGVYWSSTVGEPDAGAALCVSFIDGAEQWARSNLSRGTRNQVRAIRRF
jgi:hypothetical protein